MILMMMYICKKIHYENLKLYNKVTIHDIQKNVSL